MTGAKTKLRRGGGDSEVDEQSLHVHQAPDETRELAVAKAAIDPSMRARLNLFTWTARGLFRDTNINALGTALDQCGQAASSGDLAGLEAMLAIQARTLDVVFHDLANLARQNIQQPAVFERLLRLGLKAQSQSRSTVESLAEIKNPRSVAFIKQANVAQGHQQVNNGVPARECLNDPNELFDGRRLDTGAPGSPKTADSVLGAVAAVDRTEDAARQTSIQPEQLQARSLQS